MSASGTIDYETLAQDAMRGVIRKILKRTEEQGLPGEHHFYVSFDTNAPGVVLSRRLRETYPTDMTIVLQHRFWDLAVGDDQFEVKLTFDGIPERLVVPFKAIKVFFDPSVRYALQFEHMGSELAQVDSEDFAGDGDAPQRPTTRSLTPVSPAPVATFPRAAERDTPPNTDDIDDLSDDDTDELTAVDDADGARDPSGDNTGETTEHDDSAAGESGEEPADAEAEDEDANSAVVVSLDAFRKK